MSITTENKVGMIDSIELFVPKGDWELFSMYKIRSCFDKHSH